MLNSESFVDSSFHLFILCYQVRMELKSLGTLKELHWTISGVLLIQERPKFKEQNGIKVGYASTKTTTQRGLARKCILLYW